VTALSSYLFSVLREGEIAIYRGSGDGLEPTLRVAPVGEYSAHESRAMAGMTLGLEDPGGEAATQCLQHGAGRGHPGAACRERDEASRDDRRGAPPLISA
jgi:hypothetical protein